MAMAYYHVLTHISGAIGCVMLCIIVAFTVLAVRGMRAHRAAEASGAARGTAITSWAFGCSLPTLLRAASVACCVGSIFCGTLALVANWLVVDPARDYAMRYFSPVEDPAHSADFSPEGQLCIALAKMGPPMYASTKSFSYLFFFLKSRTVRPTERMSWTHKSVLFVTLQMFTFAGCGVWLVVGDAIRLDDTCSFWVPPWMVVLMCVADVALSSMYCVLFLAPLRETIRANRAMRCGGAAAAARAPPVTRGKVTPADSATTAVAAADPRQQALAAASARGSALETVMRRNLQSCVLSILWTAATMGFIMVAHLLDQQHMRKISWALGTTDLAITCLSIEHLMHKSGPSAAAGPSTANAGANGAAHKGAAAMTVVGSKAHSSNHGHAGSALGRHTEQPQQPQQQQQSLQPSPQSPQSQQPPLRIRDAGDMPRGSTSPPTASSSLGFAALASTGGPGPQPQPQSRAAPSPPMHNRYMVSSPDTVTSPSSAAASPPPPPPPPRGADVVLEMQSADSSPPPMDALPGAALE